MRITTVAGSEQISRGNKLEAIRGRITKIFERKSGSNEHGDWSMQTIVFTDDTGTIDVMLKDREPLHPDWKGCMVLITAGEYKGNPCGIEMDEYKEKRRFKVTASATIEDGTETGGQQSQPQQQRPQQRPQQQPQQRPQQRQSIQDEERQEQQNARPQNQQQPPPRQQAQQAPPDAETYIKDTKRAVMGLAHLFTICHDAAVLHATSVYNRHGIAPPPASIGALATTLFIESNRKQIGANLPPTDLTRLTAPTFRMEDIVNAYEQHAREATAPLPPEEKPLAELPDQQW